MGEQVREIKFRAWNGKEMFNVDVLAISPCTWDCPDYGKRGVSLAYQPHIKVMQYTGLHDKNGKEIYEGDILYCHGATGVPLLQSYALPAKNPRGEKFIVVKLDCGYVLRHISTFGKSGYEIPNCIINGWTLMHNYDFWNHQRSFDVIGNIYANKELLGAEHE